MNFSPLRDKENSTWNCVIPLLCRKFLLLKTFWNTEGFSWDFSRCCETKNLRHKNVFYDSCAHNFLISEVSQTQNNSPANRDVPVLCTKISRYPKFPETFFNGSPENFFCSVRQKFQRQIVLYLSCAQKLSKPEISESYKGSFTNFFWFCETIKFPRENRESPLFCVKIFDAQNSLKL